MHRCEVSSWFRFCVRVRNLGLKVSVRAVTKKPRTRNQHDTDAFLSNHAKLFSPKTAGHSIFGPPFDILGVLSERIHRKLTPFSPLIVNHQNYF